MVWLVCIALAEELPEPLPQGYRKVITGVGKVNAAMALSTILASDEPI